METQPRWHCDWCGASGVIGVDDPNAHVCPPDVDQVIYDPNPEIDPQFFTNYAEIAPGFLHQGGAAGLDFYDSLTLVAIELAIQSGDMAVPMSQEECEIFPTGPLNLEHVLPLAEKYPEFHVVARRWAFQKSPALFAQFHNS